VKTKEHIAVLGSGVAGISAAWLLRKYHDVRLFERHDYFGGHTHTIVVDESGGARVPVDTGFIVYNEPNYPHLTGLFDVLGVKTRDTDMSFAASVGDPPLEYAGSDLNTLFAQRRNLFSRPFLAMVWDILRFNRHPVFDRDAMSAQRRLSEIQGRDRIWYTGSYFGYGFHEDALRASVELAERFGVRAPWLPLVDSRVAESIT
jgi:predicted NAD/FAD-binding protein